MRQWRFLGPNSGVTEGTEGGFEATEKAKTYGPTARPAKSLALRDLSSTLGVLRVMLGRLARIAATYNLLQPGKPVDVER